MPTTLFLDCEFTDLAQPQLLSLALVSLDGREWYAQWSLDCARGSALAGQANSFVQDTVLPQFETLPQSGARSWAEFGQGLVAFLESIGTERLEVAYDFHADFDLLESLLRNGGLWATWQTRLEPTHVGYLLGSPDSERAMEKAWHDSFMAQGLERHHALADARALRAAYLALHGEASAT